MFGSPLPPLSCDVLSSSQETIRQDTSERKPGENVDSSQWKNTVRYERTEGEYFAGTRVSEILRLASHKYHLCSFQEP